MKNLISTIAFLLIAITVSAQNNNTEKSNTNTKEVMNDSFLQAIVSKDVKATSIDTLCYSETSKVAFYEALISKNGFDIQLKNSNTIAIRNTEEIINSNRDRILYSEEE